MKTTVNGMFKNHNDAADAVREIKAAGVAQDEISIVTNKVADRGKMRGTAGTSDTVADGAADGALVGGALGGGAGLLAGLGAIAIPGLGPLLGAGWLISTAIGAAVGATGGGLIGALVDAGVDDHDAETYVEGIRSGGTLVSVRVQDADVSAVQAIMMQYNGMDRTSGDSVVRTMDKRTTLGTGGTDRTYR